MNERERALDHKCPNCGSKLEFKPELGKWKCDSCNSEFDLETLQKFNNASSKENNKNEEEPKKTKDNGSYVEYHCKNCGAKIIADEQTAATFCVYCGNTAILKSKLSGKFAPSKIIPFKKTRIEAIEAFRSLYKGRPLMPKFFNDVKNIEKITGVYIPFWLFTISTNGKMDVSAKRITTWTIGDMQYTKTDSFSVKRDADMKFFRIPVDGSTRFDDDIMNTIEPFNYNDLVDYNHAYLSGFLAEKYDVEDEKAVEDAKSRADKTTKNVLNNSLGYYTIKTVLSQSYTDNIDKTEYVLLPVWMVNVKYNEKFYTFAMNAQTGEFVGNIPADKKKAFLLGIAIFVGVTLLVLLITYLVFLGGK